MPTSQLRVRVFDGSRQELAGDSPVLMTIMDGNQQVIIRKEFPSGTIFDVPFPSVPT